MRRYQPLVIGYRGSVLGWKRKVEFSLLVEGEHDIGEFGSKVFADQDLETKMDDPIQKRQNPWGENSPRGIFRIS